MKKIFLSLLTYLLPLVAFADAVEIDGIYYNIISKSKGAEVTSSPNRYSGNVVIPASITYDGVEYSVTSIGQLAFSNCNNLTSITIPKSVSLVRETAFTWCFSLTSVIISDISAWCSILFMNEFSNPLQFAKRIYLNDEEIKELIIPNNVTSIGEYAFYNCISLISVIIPNSVTTIGHDAFYSCSSLTSVTIPSGVTEIGTSAFSGCSSLTSVEIPSSVTEIGSGAFSNCSSLTSVSIPNSVTSLNGVFYNCISLTSITIPNSVTSIGNSAFSYCKSLTSITIPNSVTEIGEKAFSNCSSLNSVSIGSSVKEINSYSFAYCPELTDVFCLAEYVPSTDNSLFYGSYIEYATLHVPENSLIAYKSVEPWNLFRSIVTLDDVNPEAQKCATPSIGYQNGNLSFSCETEGATFVTDIADPDIKTHYDSNISLTVTYYIKVYATKLGYNNSDEASAMLCWIDQQPRTEGITDGLAQIPARPVLIKTDRGQFTIEGVDDQTNIAIFTTDGKQAGSAISQNGVTNIDTNLQAGTSAIVKIGEKSVKVLVK